MLGNNRTSVWHECRRSIPFVFALGFCFTAFTLSLFGLQRDFAFSYRAAPLPARVIKASVWTGTGTYINLEKANIAALYEKCIHIHEAHARKHGHLQVVSKVDYMPNDGTGKTYNKVALLLRIVLEELEKDESLRSEWIVWFDLDTIIMNPLISLETFLPPRARSDLHLLISRDAGGINDGVFFLRISPWSLLFLSSVLGMSKGSQPLRLWEQDAMSILLRDNEYFKKGYQQIPRHWINSYPTQVIDTIVTGEGITAFRPGYFLLHMVATTKKQVALYENYTRIAQAQEPAWADPIAALRIKDEATSFWASIPNQIPA